MSKAPTYNEPPSYEQIEPLNKQDSAFNQGNGFDLHSNLENQAFAGYSDESLEYFSRKVIDSPVSVRQAFVMKVYLLLASQLGLTTFIGALFYSVDSIRFWVQSNGWMVWISMIASFGFLIAAQFNRHKYPMNLYLLSLFTISISYMIGVIVSFYSAITVLLTLLTTFVVVLCLSAYAVLSRRDFEGWGPFLYSALIAVVVTSFAQLFLVWITGNSFPIFNLILSVVITLLFSAYLIYDTYMIFNRMSPEEYIVAVLELYLDIINLFLGILRLIGEARGE